MELLGDDGWNELLAFYRQLEDRHEIEKLDAVALEKLARARGRSVPTWFRGVGRARSKLIKKTALSKGLICSSPLAEMASNEAIARHRFSKWLDRLGEARSIHVPLCGAGLDALVLADLIDQRKMSSSVELRLSDSDEAALRCARANMELKYPAQLVACLHTRFEEAEDFHTPAEGWIFADPSRRGTAGRGGYSPDLDTLLRELEKYDRVLVKLAPGENLDEFELRFPGWDLEVMEYRGEIREVCASRDSDSSGTMRRASRLADGFDGSVLESFAANPGGVEVASHPLIEGMALIRPRPVLRRAGLSAAWAGQYGLTSVEGHDGLWCGKGGVPLAQSCKLLKVWPGRESLLRKEIRSVGMRINLESEGFSPWPGFDKFVAQCNSRLQGVSRGVLLLTRFGVKKVGLLLGE